MQDYPAAGLDSSKVFYRADAIAFAEATTEKGLPAIICATLPENMDLETRQLLIEKGTSSNARHSRNLECHSGLSQLE